MARSRYIYIISHDAPQNMSAPHVIAAFTVKHELITWLEKCDHHYKKEFSVYRIIDNDKGETYKSNCKILTQEDLTP